MRKKLGFPDWKKLFPGWKKPEPLDWLEIAIFGLCVIAPFLVHEGASCHGAGVFHSAIFHSPFLYEMQMGKSSCLRFEFDRYSCWELFGIIQASAVSFFLLFRVKEFTRAVLLIAAAIVVLGPLACLLLLTGEIFLYQIFVIAILVSFCLEDYNLYRRSRHIEYMMLIRFVDIPIVISVTVLTGFVGFPIHDEYRNFYSGAIAFQLIAGTLLLILIRLQNFLKPINNLAIPNTNLSDQSSTSGANNPPSGSENKQLDTNPTPSGEANK